MTKLVLSQLSMPKSWNNYHFNWGLTMSTVKKKKSLSLDERISKVTRAYLNMTGSRIKIQTVNGFDPPKLVKFNSHFYDRPLSNGDPRVKVGMPIKKTKIVVGRGWLCEQGVV